MKRVISTLLCIAMLLSALSGCGQNNVSSEVSDESTKVSDKASDNMPTESVPPSTNDAPEAEDVHTEVGETESRPSGTTEFDWEPEIKFTGMNDQALLSYIEDSAYSQLITDLDGTEYIVEDVSAVYVSQEYMQALAYNSKTNVFFGYSLADLDAYFEGTRYVFTLGEDGQTTVEPLQVVEDTTYDQIIKNVAVGTGVILVCVTVSAATAGVGSTAAVSMIFAVAAKTGAVCALSGSAISGVTSAVVKGYQTGDFSEALKAGALGASEGYKWGAISGMLTGGAGEAWGLYSATGKGLTMNEVAIIQKESGYPLSVIKQFHSFDEYTVFKQAGLKADMIGGKLTLARSDIDLYNVVDEYGRNNYTRMSKGLNPIDGSGNTFQWHHIGQENDATLALLTAAEHDAGALHGFKVVSEIDRAAFDAYKKTLNKDLLKWMLNNAG